jgi:uncharacterized delta-60 repeat protein
VKTVLTITSAVLLTVLAACSSNTPTPIAQADQTSTDQTSLETSGLVGGPIGPVTPINCNYFVFASKLDNCFGKSGKVLTGIRGLNASNLDDQANAVRVQTDGKIVVAGKSYNGLNWDIALTRYNTDGSLDATFGTGGKVTTAIGTGFDEVANAMVIQNDGKILVTGTRSTEQPSYKSNLLTVRYNDDGSLDINFGYEWIEWFDRGTWRRVKSRTPGYKLGPDMSNWDTKGQTAIGIQSDGKIVVAGHSHIALYTQDGGPHDTFTMDNRGYSSISYIINELVIQPDDKILIAGERFNYGSRDAFLARYNPDGSIDTGFGDQDDHTTVVRLDATVFPKGHRTFTDGVFTSLVIQNDGKILAAGWTWALTFVPE